MSISDVVPWSWGKKKASLKKSEDQFSALRRQMNDVFENFLSGSDWGLPDLFVERESFVPKVNVADRNNEVVVTAELPGLTQDQVQIELSNDALLIRGEKRETREEHGDDKTRHYIESSYGSFQRIIPLSAEIDQDKVDASFKNGVLTVKLPKSARAQSAVKKVSIRGE